MQYPYLATSMSVDAVLGPQQLTASQIEVQVAAPDGSLVPQGRDVSAEAK